MPVAKIVLLFLCLTAFLGCAGCAPTGSAGAAADETVHYGYGGSRPAACAACEE